MNFAERVAVFNVKMAAALQLAAGSHVPVPCRASKKKKKKKKKKKRRERQTHVHAVGEVDGVTERLVAANHGRGGHLHARHAGCEQEPLPHADRGQLAW